MAQVNRLSREQSPYLLQHADNPVDWYPWGEEAFEKARQEDKMIFLSIGYSTCHWCHVMAEESFEDAEVARLMSETFISIKVDREERPDIDGVYMTVCQMMTGSGGWPLTIVMTPDKDPFFAGTYIPRETRFGRSGILDLIPKLKDLWNNQRQDVLNAAAQTKSALRQTTASRPGKEPGEAELGEAFQQLLTRFDTREGGFGTAPKFPTPHNLMFLLRHWKRTGDDQALFMVEKTLQGMRRGGIYDQVGFGFHRYSTDARWLVPHFEKMLYDQALTAMAYIETFQATGKEEYAGTAREIFSYVLRDMLSSEGAFFSAEDADSEGREGKFYIWTLDEVKDALKKEDADLAVQLFNVLDKGNYVDEIGGGATGANILHLTQPVSIIAMDFNMSEGEFLKRIETVREKMFAYREKRVHPHKDDKVLTDWNGLMIAALARGARVLDQPEFAAAAERAANFILTGMRTGNGRLLHRYRNGKAGVTATLDDYAFFIQALLELYETTFEAKYLKAALELNRDMLGHFRDQSDGGLFFTADDAEELIMRRKEVYDGATPSGNSVAMLNLLRLGRLTAESGLEEASVGIARAFSEQVRQAASAYTQFLMAVDFAVGPSSEIIITGDPGTADTEKMIAAVQRPFFPNKIVLLRPSEEDSPEIDGIAPFIKNFRPVDGKTAAFVCRNYQCRLPVTEPEKIAVQLE